MSFKNIAALMTAVQQVFQELPTHYSSLAAAYPLTSLLPLDTLLPPAWLAGNTSRNQKDLQQLDYFRLLPVLTYCLTVTQQQRPLDWPMLYRVIRYFFNLHRTASVSKNPADACAEGIILAQQLAVLSDDIAVALNQSATAGALPREERRKFALYQRPPLGVERTTVEALLWQLEDHPFNSGEISHLLSADDYELSFSVLQEVEQNFLILLPPKPDLPLLQKALLYYGSYWQQESPWYYSIYNFQDWFTIIRGRQFRTFFAEFSQQQVPLSRFYLNRQAAYFKDTSVQQLRQTATEGDQLIVLSALYDLAQARYGQTLSLWDVGGYIGFHHSAVSKYPVFETDREYMNARRYLGSYPVVTLTDKLEQLCAKHGESISQLLGLLAGSPVEAK